MEFRILGSTEVQVGTRRVPLASGRGRALLALLILHAGQTVSVERLIDELWGEHPPPTARTVIHGHVSRLRRELEPHRASNEAGRILQTMGSGYRLAINPDAVDANRFERLLTQARSAMPADRSAMLSAALDLWRGPALEDFRYEPFAQQAIRALEGLRIEAIEDRIEAELALGRSNEVVTELERLIALHPFRERLRGLLMLALYRGGRQTDALAVFHSTRALLVEEMGLEPGPALQELETAILCQDPDLEMRSEQGAGTGVATTAASWLPRERRPVTVVAVDVAPTATSAVDPEAVGRLEAKAADAAIQVLERHGGRVDRFVGGMVTGFFGLPVAREDDASRAVRAGLEVRRAVAALNDEPLHEGLRSSSRIGIENGELVVQGPGAGLRDTAGTVVTSALRLQQAAADEEILVGPTAQPLLRGSVVLKSVGKAASSGGAEAAWSVLDIVTRAPSVPRTFDKPMFGRQDELARMRSAFRRAARSGTAVRISIIGEAGIGKSRLAKELATSLDEDSHTITVRCPPYGGGAVFFPLRQAVINAAGLYGWRALYDLLADERSGRLVTDIGNAIGLPATVDHVEVLFPAFRRLLGALASQRPLIVVLEDLHWAEPTFLELVEDVSNRATGPILMLCVTRPELIERQPHMESSNALYLEPLSRTDLESLVIDRAGAIGADTLDRIVELSKGNPLFTEQLIASLGEGDLDAVPGSLRGLLAMRLDQLGPGERDLLRSASIVGIEFDQAALSALLPPAAQPFVQQHLHGLLRKRLLQSSGTGGFRFSHVLVQLAAYHSMTHDDRARLHETFAHWLDDQSPVALDDLSAKLDHHRTEAAEHHRASGIPSR
jgi:DNA-binding SARP family transcriptional activator